MTSRSDTIAAIATPPGAGGIAVVRVSGARAREIVGALFRRRNGTGVPENRRVYVGVLLDRPGGRPLDEVLAFWNRGPHTYTGEDVVEVQCHGGSLVSQRVLESIYAAGARPAQPGEFTKRAFLNGRIDLAQAEAVADLITAHSEAGRRLAWSQLEGTLSARVDVLRETILRARARCEVALDFAEDDVPELTAGELGRELANVRRELESLVATFERGRLRYAGARVALVGRPNVGKSSLLNAMVGRDRALVTPIAGTTRDVVDVSVAIDGAPVVLMDTAGVREASDVVESLGIERTRRAVEDAVALVAVFDGSSPLEDDDALVAELVREKSTVIVVNKTDLPRVVASERVAALVGSSVIVEVSARIGHGVAELSARLGALLFGGSSSQADDEVVLFRARHHEAARKAVAELARAEEGLSRDVPLELIASDLIAAATALGEITGAITSEDVLDRVFADFCLGK